MPSRLSASIPMVEQIWPEVHKPHWKRHVDERGLNQVQVIAQRQSFDGGDRLPVMHHGKRQQ